MKEEELKENLKEIEKLSIDKENVEDKIDKLMNDYETVDNIVKENIQTIKDFESNFVKEKILNFIKEYHDEIRLKLYLIKEAEKRIKESGKNESIGGSHPATYQEMYQKQYPNSKTGVPSYVQDFQDKPHKEEGNEPSSNNKKNYDVEQDKNDLNEYKNDYFTIMFKIKEIINPSIIEKEIEHIKNKNKEIKDDINEIKIKYNIK
jgi:hypothetical protein